MEYDDGFEMYDPFEYQDDDRYETNDLYDDDAPYDPYGGDEGLNERDYQELYGADTDILFF